MKSEKAANAFFLLVITLIFAYDYFLARSWSAFINENLLLLLQISILIGSILYYQICTPATNVQRFRYSLFILLYFPGLMLVLTMLGGTSYVGLTLDSISFWGVMLIGVINLIRQWKKMKQTGA
ncbi:hypothetical protein [Brevibacillus daliensis]|uniref:hypothetical protein n=1 Tax=Brevibacillus daliensis TaxID=2892995 RepID=UPI001E2B4875|nr:hypothetical protein [Brevibacillus daliensis]